MFYASNLEVRESGYTAFGLSDRYNEFSPNTESPLGQRGQQYPQLALGPVPKHRLQGRLPVGQNYV